MQHYLKQYLFFFIFVFITFSSQAQLRDTDRWRAVFSVGVNSPESNGFVNGSYAKSINFPTINLGLQHFITRELGVKVDYGFNRFTNDEDTPEFKINYSRINIQALFDPTDLLGFFPPFLRTVVHAGPGYSIVKPLGNLGDNKQSYLNANVGIEFNYALSDKVAIFTDASYIYGFTSLDDYNPALSGLGAFNGSVFNLTFGVAISVGRCRYCYK